MYLYSSNRFPLIEKGASLQVSKGGELHACCIGQLVNGGWPWSACGMARGGRATPRQTDTLGSLRQGRTELRGEQKNRRNRWLGSPQSATRNAHDVGICVPARVQTPLQPHCDTHNSGQPQR